VEVTSGNDGPGLLALSLHLDGGPDADEADIEDLSRALRDEILDQDVEQVKPAPSSAEPSGAKLGDPVTWQTLLVSLSASGGVLASVVAAVSQWLSRRREPVAITVKIGEDTVSLSNATEQERSQLVAAFIQRHQQA
jgi:hypothetical protein